jgi:DNA-binding HxlR family transcriptional regulator
LARAAEVLGERWTLLIVRELLLGPKRFSDLRERLDGISPSVLTERLARVEELELVRRMVLPPPAASSVYELTEHGEALRPAVYELIRWGGRFLQPRRKGERVEPEWMRLALDALARRGASPRRRVVLRVREGRTEALVHVAGGRRGTTVSAGRGPADATLVIDVQALLAVASGRLSLARACRKRVASWSRCPFSPHGRHDVDAFSIADSISVLVRQ